MTIDSELFKGALKIAGRNRSLAIKASQFRLVYAGKTYEAVFNAYQSYWEVTCNGEHVANISSVKPSTAKKELLNFLNS